MSQADPTQALYNRVRYLPRQLDSARRKVAALENEARRYGMLDLLSQPVELITANGGRDG